jgi:hypothetical protein
MDEYFSDLSYREAMTVLARQIRDLRAKLAAIENPAYTPLSPNGAGLIRWQIETLEQNLTRLAQQATPDPERN